MLGLNCKNMEIYFRIPSGPARKGPVKMGIIPLFVVHCGPFAVQINDLFREDFK